MAFDKITYWKNRKNQEKVLDKEGKPVKDEDGKVLLRSAPRRGQGVVEKFPLVPNPDVPMTITDGGIVYQTRKYKRSQEFKSGKNFYKKAGYVDYLQKIRKVRKQHGKIITKYYKVDL